MADQAPCLLCKADVPADARVKVIDAQANVVGCVHMACAGKKTRTAIREDQLPKRDCNCGHTLLEHEGAGYCTVEGCACRRSAGAAVTDPVDGKAV